ncbi:MAG: TauD/TfdA family dioxygenase [Pseudomonadota bacterium]
MQICPITPNVGAEIHDIDAGRVTDAERRSLRDALVNYKVLVLRDQDIDSFAYRDFVTTFGEVVMDDLTPQPGHPPELGAIHIQPKERQTINFWHMDYSFREQPTPVLSLCAKLLPEIGGDTLFTNLEAAYDGLPGETKARIEGLYTNHKVTPTQNSAKRFSPAEFEQMITAAPVRHPLVCTNPDNGRKFLFVNVPIYCRSIVGLEDDPEGDALLRSLYEHASRPEFHFRLRWTLNTIVVWENTHCLHYPVADYFPNERRLWRFATKATARPAA